MGKPRYIKKWFNFKNKVEKIKASSLKPLLKLLAVLSVTPNMVSFSGIIFALFFAILIKTNLTLALIFLIVSLLTDGIDGALARYQKKASDRGKFVDVFCSSIVVVIFLAGIVYAGLVSGLVALVFAYLNLLSKVLAAIKNSAYLKSDWRFKIFTGPLPNITVILTVVLFFISALWSINYLDLFLIVFSIILAIEIISDYNKVLKWEKKK